MSNDDPIRDHVFPIVEARGSDDPRLLDFVRLRGTGFRVRVGGLGLTAAHVVRDPEHLLVALFADDAGGWTWRAISEIQAHPSEDAASFRLVDDRRELIFALGKSDVRSSYECDVWGYPEDVLYDVVHQGRALVRPDLVFATGHVRRRRRPGDFLPGGGGSVVAEVDFVAGGGCSGSPVVGRDQRGKAQWTVAGIYLGEQQTQEGERRGFFLLAETFLDWKAIGSPIAEGGKRL